MRVAIYARVSTQRQAQAQTIEQQMERLLAYVQQEGWSLSEENIFRDDGYSGSGLNRPGLDRLRDRVATDGIDQILLTAPDRLARNYVHQMVLLEEFENYGCRVTFLDRPMSQDPHDQLLLQIRGAVAEYERTLIADRMRRGRQSKYRAGILLPWTQIPYGYQVQPDHPRDPSGVQIQEEQAAIIREIFAFYLQIDTSLYGVVQHLHEMQIPSPKGEVYWNTATVRGILTNPAYSGKVYANRTHSVKPRHRRSATHLVGKPAESHTTLPEETWLLVASIPAIIRPEQLEEVKVKLSRNKQFARRNNTAHAYLLRALVSCGVCNLSCTARQLNPGYAYYVCRGKDTQINSHLAQRCPARFIPANQLDELVWKDICEVMLHPEIMTIALQQAQNGAWLPQELQARRENLRKAKNALQKQLDRLTEAYLNEVIPLSEYQRRRGELEHRQQGLEEQEQQLTRQVDRQKELAGLQDSVVHFSQRIQVGLENASFEQKRKLIELLIDRVVVKDGDVEIRYIIPTNPESEHIRFCQLHKDYFDGKSPQVHLAKIRERDRQRSSPEQPHGSFVTGLPICFQEFNPQQHAHQSREFFEMQPLPGLQTNRLGTQLECLRPIRLSRRAGELEARAMFARSTLFLGLASLRLLIQDQVAAQSNQCKGVLQ
jgi:site-specific DNA recombinase